MIALILSCTMYREPIKDLNYYLTVPISVSYTTASGKTYHWVDHGIEDLKK